VNIRNLIAVSAEQLSSAGIDQPIKDVRRLIRHVTKKEFIDETQILSTEERDNYDKALQERILRKPISKIIGLREFFGNSFIVTTDVLDPRQDSEIIVEHALVGICENKRYRILDLGTGSGCLLLSVLKNIPKATGIGVDISVEALNVARENAKNMELESRAEFQHGNWLENISEKFDIILCNPPYIDQSEVSTLSPEVTKFDPMVALTPGQDGLEIYKQLIPKLSNYLFEDGKVILEVGYDQAKKVRSLLGVEDKYHISSRNDLEGHERSVCGILK